MNNILDGIYWQSPTIHYEPPIIERRTFTDKNEKSQCLDCRHGTTHTHNVIVKDPRKERDLESLHDIWKRVNKK